MLDLTGSLYPLTLNKTVREKEVISERFISYQA